MSVPTSTPAPTVDDIPALAADAAGWFVTFNRALTAYASLVRAYQSAQGTTPPGERVAGLPILTHTAQSMVKLTPGAESSSVVCHTDLRNVPPEHLQGVLVGLVHAHVPMLRDATRELRERFNVWPPLSTSWSAATPTPRPDRHPPRTAP
jgi:hypothetical protein